MAGFMLAIQVFGQIPGGYYDSAQGLYETQLQQALHNIIDNHESLSYDNLWDAFYDTDPRPENSNLVYDMYSDNPNGPEPYTYTFGEDQCGNYSGEGSCYNREHSWPKSWFNDASPMYTDLVHLVPTDGYVNGRRSNYPYGEVNNATWTSENGSKLGYTNASWTSDKVFEPIDEYKGDFARIYFYMSVRYYNEDGNWNSNDMVDGSQLKPGPLAMMMEWHENDPVSQKEQFRNDAIYDWQNNRNPFVDHPEYVEYIWGDPQSVINSQGMDDISVSPNPAKDFIQIAAPAISPNGFEVSLYDYCGKQVLKESIKDQKSKLNVSELQNGVYILRIKSLTNGELTTRKIIKQ